MSEGGKDNSDGTANNIDTFTSNPISTDVRALSPDFVAGHSLAVGRSFSTGGIDCAGAKLPANCNDASFPLGDLNRHGTAVTVPVNAEVTATDVGPTVGTCPPAVTTCFGYGSQPLHRKRRGHRRRHRRDDALGRARPAEWRECVKPECHPPLRSGQDTQRQALRADHRPLHVAGRRPTASSSSRSSSPTRTSRRRSGSRSTGYPRAGIEFGQESNERRRPALTTSPFRS